MAGRATSTEQAARWATRSLTLPRARTPVRPRLPTTTSEHRLARRRAEDLLARVTRGTQHGGLVAKLGGEIDRVDCYPARIAVWLRRDAQHVDRGAVSVCNPRGQLDPTRRVQ